MLSSGMQRSRGQEAVDIIIPVLIMRKDGKLTPDCMTAILIQMKRTKVVSTLAMSNLTNARNVFTWCRDRSFIAIVMELGVTSWDAARFHALYAAACSTTS